MLSIKNLPLLIMAVIAECSSRALTLGKVILYDRFQFRLFPYRNQIERGFVQLDSFGTYPLKHPLGFWRKVELRPVGVKHDDPVPVSRQPRQGGVIQSQRHDDHVAGVDGYIDKS